MSLAIPACNPVQLPKALFEKQISDKGLSRNVVNVESATLSYWVGGIGPTVLLIHGFGGPSIYQWSSQIDAIIGKYRLIIPDLIWFGNSYSEVKDYSVDHQVRVLVDLLSHLAAEEVDVVGLGYGGFVAYEMGAGHPNIVRSVALVGTPGRSYTHFDLDAMCWRFKVSRLADILLPKNRAEARRLMEISYYEPPTTMGYVLDTILDELNNNHREEKTKLLDWLETHLDGLDKRKSEIDKPVLLVWGRDNKLFPLELGKRLADRLGKNARLHVIDQAKNSPNQERKDVFNGTLLDFFEGINEP